MKRTRAESDDTDEQLQLAVQFSLAENLAHDVSNEHFNLDITSAVSESLADEHERIKESYETDRAIAESILEADKKTNVDRELDYAFALSLETNEWVQNNFWLCSFCSYYSPPSCMKCIMCDTVPWIVQESAAELPGTSLSIRSRRCGLPGCRVLLPAGGDRDFCSVEHRKAAEQKRILPSAEMGVYTVFLGPSGMALSIINRLYIWSNNNSRMLGDYSMHLLTKAHPEHPLVKAQFLDAWLNPSYGKPHVMRIYKIINNPQIVHSFEALSVLGSAIKSISKKQNKETISVNYFLLLFMIIRQCAVQVPWYLAAPGVLLRIRSWHSSVRSERLQGLQHLQGVFLSGILRSEWSPADEPAIRSRLVLLCHQ